MVADVGDAVGAGGVEVAEGAFGFDDQGCGFGFHDLAIAPGVADVNQQLGVAGQVKVAGGKVGELHGAVGPVGGHFAHGNILADDVVFYVAGVNAVGDFAETGFPIFAFPAVGRIGVDGEGFIAAADFDEEIEIVGAHGGGAGMDFVAKINSK